MDRTPVRIEVRRSGRRRRPPPTPPPCGARSALDRLRFALPLLVVLVEALPGLRSELACEEHPPQQWRRRHVRLLELVEEDARDVVVDAHAGVVDELEGSHRVTETELNRVVAVLLGRDAELEHAEDRKSVV